MGPTTMRIQCTRAGRRGWRPLIVLATLLVLALDVQPPPARAVMPRQTPALTMRAALTDGAVWIAATSDMPIDVELRDGGGLRARAGAELMDVGRWRAVLTDARGREVYPRSGDRLIARQAGAETSFALPPLTVRVYRDGDRVAGTTQPGLPVEVTLSGRGGSEPPVATVTADDNGNWSAEFAPAVDLLGGDLVTVRVGAAGGHRLRLDRQAPAVWISLLPGEITGAGAPFSAVSATLTDPITGRDLGRGQARANQDGHFAMWLRDVRGRVVRPEVGNELIWYDGTHALRTTVGRLSAFWDLPTNRLLGMGEPYAEVAVTVWSRWYPRQTDYPTAKVTYRGFWQVTPDVSLRPGFRYTVEEQLAEGDTLTYDQEIPLLGIQPGSPVVTVETRWGVTADLGLRRGTATVATAEGGGRWSGKLALVLRDAAGQPVPAQSGDVLHALLDGWEQQIQVTPFTAALDGAGHVVGTAPPGLRVWLGGDEFAVGPVTTDADGRFSLPASGLTMGADPAPGVRFQAYYVGHGDHHIQTAFQGPVLEVPVTSDGFSGRVMPEADFAVRREIADHTWWGSYEARADELGHFRGAIIPSRRPAPPKAPGDVYELATGHIATTITLPVLTASLDPVTGDLTGTGPPQDALDVAVYLGPDGDHPELLYADTDATGAYRLNLREPDLGWPSASIDPVDVHKIVLTWWGWEGANSATLTIDGPRAGWAARLFLPRVNVP